MPFKKDKVAVHYEGRLEDGTIFDSSYKRGKPFEVVIGVGKVVKGWDLGITRMELGEKALLTIREDYGYGQRKRGKIPAGSTMIFTVELLEINGEKSEVPELVEFINQGKEIRSAGFFEEEIVVEPERPTGLVVVEEDVIDIPPERPTGLVV